MLAVGSQFLIDTVALYLECLSHLSHGGVNDTFTVLFIQQCSQKRRKDDCFTRKTELM